MRLEARANDWELVSWMIDRFDAFSVAEHSAFRQDTMLRFLPSANSHCNITCTAMLHDFEIR